MTSNNVYSIRKAREHHCAYPAPLFFDSLGNPCWSEGDREDGYWMPITLRPAWLTCGCVETESMPLAA